MGMRLWVRSPSIAIAFRPEFPCVSAACTTLPESAVRENRFLLLAMTKLSLSGARARKAKALALSQESLHSVVFDGALGAQGHAVFPMPTG